MAEGRITRGTTGTNRLRRVDRWMSSLPVLRQAKDPLVVDLGYGASAATPLELRHRLARVRPDVEVVGIEIDPERVRLASLMAVPGVSFRQGGFETPLPGGRSATIIRAFNVLRQYDEHEVADAWHRMVSRLQPGGVLVEGTCNEIGRISSWAAITKDGPQTLTISLRLAQLEKPSIVAERLPKALIHRNVPGERIHDLMNALDWHWQINVGLSVYSPVQRWLATIQGLRGDGWPITGGRSRGKLGEVTVAWDSVAPR
ncbi:MAG: methylase [Homoserinimonas sp.]|jgi:hypothetical protein|nr:methylase [Homoserinimonas sp.]